MQFGLGVSALEKLKDVDLTTLSDGDIIVWNDAAQLWYPTAGSAGGAVALNDLTDVDTTGYTDGYIIQYSTTSGLWEAVPNAGGGIATEQDVIGFAVDSNKNITLSSKAFRELPYNSTILGWKLVTDTSTSNSVKISIQTTSDYSIFTEVISTELDKPQLSNAKSAEDFTLTNWTTQINKTNILRFTVDEATNVKQLHFFLTIERYVP